MAAISRSSGLSIHPQSSHNMENMKATKLKGWKRTLCYLGCLCLHGCAWGGYYLTCCCCCNKGRCGSCDSEGESNEDILQISSDEVTTMPSNSNDAAGPSRDQLPYIPPPIIRTESSEKSPVPLKKIGKF